MARLGPQPRCPPRLPGIDLLRRSAMRTAVKPLSDPIVDEIHAIREAMAKASNDDLRKIAEAARSWV